MPWPATVSTGGDRNGEPPVTPWSEARSREGRARVRPRRGPAPWAPNPTGRRPRGGTAGGGSRSRAIPRDLSHPVDLPRRGGMTTRNEIHVIGAGLAGLTAAAFVARAGVPVVVHETRNRLGGRATTDDRGGFRFD